MNSTIERTDKAGAQALSVAQVVSSLQLLLATRRAARNSELALWQAVSRGK